MQRPLMDDIEVFESIGTSACGGVYRARHGDGLDLVLKMFHEPSIRKDLLLDATRRLEEGGWPKGVLPVLAEDLDGLPPVRLTPALLDFSPDGEPQPRSLARHEMPLPVESAYEVIADIAHVLAAMHRRGVAHGNLKPDNILFDEEWRLFLTDWALGNMPGVRELRFTDALLYQAPEQLTHAVSFKVGGMKWDVFSFGVLAFRMFTGRFPRCDDGFAPAAGMSGQPGGWGGLDAGTIASMLVADPVVEWPDGVRELLLPGVLDLIGRCLSLNPVIRPASMVVVAAEWDSVVPGEWKTDRPEPPVEQPEIQQEPGSAEVAPKIEEDTECESESGKVVVRSGPWRLLFFVSAAAVVAMAVLSGILIRDGDDSASRIRNERSNWQAERRGLVDAYDEAVVARNGAQAEAEEIRRELHHERQLSLTRLEASREIGDRIFAWAMEQGHRKLPPLDGREVRLGHLERYYQDFLARTGDAPAFADERARVKLQLAEISLSAGDEPQASRRLGEALDALADVPLDSDTRLRLATDRLLLAILKHGRHTNDALQAFEDARKGLQLLPQELTGTTRVAQLRAVLDIHEAMLLTGHGEDKRALDQLTSATKTLNRLVDEQPDVAILRSELAECYLSSATILEGIGNLADAREARVLAMKELYGMLEMEPDNLEWKLQMAGCLGGMAEAALQAGDLINAESLSRQTIAHLDAVLSRQPDQTEAVIRRAAQLGLRAGILRDRGSTMEAMEDFEEGIRLLERIRVSPREQAMVSFRLALLLWQKGRTLGLNGKPDEEIELLGRAKSILAGLESAVSGAGLRQEQVQRSGAYVAGDFGHALQVAGRRDKAVEAFRDALVLWESLSRDQPKNDEYIEGLVWCRQRVKDLEQERPARLTR